MINKQTNIHTFLALLVGSLLVAGVDANDYSGPLLNVDCFSRSESENEQPLYRKNEHQEPKTSDLTKTFRAIGGIVSLAAVVYLGNTVPWSEISQVATRKIITINQAIAITVGVPCALFAYNGDEKLAKNVLGVMMIGMSIINFKEAIQDWRKLNNYI